MRRVSTQQDIVLYERDLCPVYSINGAPEATYYPIEGVIAVGEVKSVVDKPTLVDALDKVRSAKLLRRYAEKFSSLGQPPAASYRNYGAVAPWGAVASDEFDQYKKYTDQVFTFILCKDFKNSPEAILGNIADYAAEKGTEHLPNMIVSLNDGFIKAMDMQTRALQRFASSADAMAFMPEVPRAFTVLVNELRSQAREGRSVPLASLDRYMANSAAPFPLGSVRPFEK